MANRRCFSQSVVESDAFLDMPATTQSLYFHLGMYTDDDGFVVSPRRVQRSIGATDDDMRILAAKGFVIVFDSGVLVVTHHKVNNLLRNDRYKKTACIDELERLEVLPTSAYALKNGDVSPARLPMATVGIPDGNQTATVGTRNITEHNLTEHNLTIDTLSCKHDRAAMVQEIVGYLNDKAGTAYGPTTKATARLIQTRLNEGFSVEDFKTVIDNMTAKWGNDPNMCQYLRPQTLFGTKFESYLQTGGKRHDYSVYDC